MGRVLWVVEFFYGRLVVVVRFFMGRGVGGGCEFFYIRGEETGWVCCSSLCGELGGGLLDVWGFLYGGL